MKKTSFLTVSSLMRALMFIGIAGLSFTGCRTARPLAEPTAVVTPSGLEYTITQMGNMIAPEEGDIVKLHYTGKLEDGTIFDSSYDRGEPISFRMGSGQVIAGLEEGVSQLRQGSRATLVIPPDLAYGSRATGPIPANATLTFEVEILEITRTTASSEVSALPKTRLESGLEYSIIQRGNGRRLEDGMRVSVHYSGYLEDNTMFDSSYERGRPIQFILGKGMVIRGWDEGLAQLQVGDKARLYIPYDLAYGPTGRGPIPANADLIFDIEVVDAMLIEAPRPFEVNGLDTVQLESGLKYVLVREGQGPAPEPGQVLIVHYSGYLTDGTMFDSSVQRGEPFRFVLGQGQVIRGWDEGFAQLTKGGRARLIIPPHMAYGDRDMGVIPPGSTLVFDVELIDF